MQIQNFKNKIGEILESYLIYIGYKMAFIKDDELTEQLNHRREQCEACPLNRNGWCSNKRLVIAEVNGKYTSKRGCGCYLPSKFFSQYKKNSCPMNKWEK